MVNHEKFVRNRSKLNKEKNEEKQDGMQLITQDQTFSRTLTSRIEHLKNEENINSNDWMMD